MIKWTYFYLKNEKDKNLFFDHFNEILSWLFESEINWKIVYIKYKQFDFSVKFNFEKSNNKFLVFLNIWWIIETDSTIINQWVLVSEIFEIILNEISNKINIEKISINDFYIKTIPPPVYLFWDWVKENWKRIIKNTPYITSELKPIHIYYFPEFINDSLNAIKKLKFSLKYIYPKMQIYVDEIKNISNQSNVDWIIYWWIVIPSNLCLDSAQKIYSRLSNLDLKMDFIIFDYAPGTKEKWANIAYQILYKQWFELWRIEQLKYTNDLYIWIDSSLQKNSNISNLGITFFNSVWKEYKEHRVTFNYIWWERIPIWILNKLLEEKMCSFKEKFSNITVHKDWKFIGENLMLLNLLNKYWNNINLVEVIKRSTGSVINSNEWDYFDFWNFILLNTHNFSGQAWDLYWNPLKIKIYWDNNDKDDILSKIYYFSKIYSWDSIYSWKRLPSTTFIADKISWDYWWKWFKKINA